MVGQLLLALAILVTLHECGHFWAARFFKIRVEKFYLFFDFLFPLPNVLNFSLFKKKIGDTVYGLGWFPMGGYVQIGGMMDENMDKEAMAQPVRPDDFRAKPAWQRLIVMIGGVVINLILGIIIFIGIKWYYGEQYIPMDTVNDKIGIYVSPKGEKFGIKTGDKILQANGKKVESIEDIMDFKFLFSSNPQLLINRNGKDTLIQFPKYVENVIERNAELPYISLQSKFSIKTVNKNSAADKLGLKEKDVFLTVNGKSTPHFFSVKEALLNNKGKKIEATFLRNGKDTIKGTTTVEKDGTLGFFPELENYEQYAKTIHNSFGESISKGTSEAFGKLFANIKGFGRLFSGKVNVKNSVGGPISIAQAFGSHWDWEHFWNLCGMLSLVLAFMNILPIPALDGGHVMFLLWEMITGKPASDKVLYVGQVIGTVIVLGLLVFTFWVDISRLLGF